MKPWEMNYAPEEKAPWEEDYLQPKLKKGLGAALERGTRGLVGSLRTGVESLLPEENAAANAAIKGVQRQEELAQEIEAPTSLERVKEAYRKKGLLSAAGEVISQVPGAIVEQAPQIGAMVAGARVGATAGPWGALIGAAAVPLAQFYGSNLERQAAEQISSGRPVDVDRGKAAIAAAPQAAFDIVQQRLLFGQKLFSKALGIPEATLMKQNAQQVEKLAREKLIPTLLKGTGKGIVAEIPTEIGQQMIERAQAGLSITSPDALAEYGDTAYQVGLLGPLGAVGRISEKGAARQEVARKEAEALAAQQAVPPDTTLPPPVTPSAPPATLPSTGLPTQAALFEGAGPQIDLTPPTAEAFDPNLLPELRQQYDTIDREIDRLAMQFQQEQDPAKKQMILVQAQKLDYARQELEGRLKGAPTRPGVAPVAGQAELDFTAPLPKDRLPGAPVIIGEQPTTPDTTAVQLELLRQRRNAGMPLTPAEEFTLREADKAERAELEARPTPQLELPVEVGAGARPTSYLVDDAALKTFGLSPKANAIKNALRGLDLMDPQDKAKFDELIAKHERKNAKIDMQAVEDFLASVPESVAAREVPEAAGLPAREYTPRQQYQQAREAMFAFGQEAAPISSRDRAILAKQQFEAKNGPVPEVGTRTSEPSVSMPSGELQSTEGAGAPTTTGLAGTEPAAGRPAARERIVGKTQQGPLSPFAQMVQQVAPETKPDLKEKKAKPKKLGFGEVEKPAPTRKGTAYMQGDLQGKATIELADRITQGDLKGALQEIATSKQFTPLDNLVAKRLLQAKSLPKVEIVSAEVTGGAPAQYDPNTDTVQITSGNIDSHTVLHETVHGFLHVMIRQSQAREARGLGGNPKLNNLKDVYKHVQKTRPDLVEKYGMTDLSEFASEAMSNPDFQNDLRNTPYKKSNVFAEFGRAVLRLLGINLDQSNIADINSLAAALMSAESALSTGRKMQEDVQGGVRQEIEPDVAKVERTAEGTQAEQLMDAFGGKPEAQEQSFIQKKQASFNKAKEAWQESYERNESRVAATFGKAQNIASFDQAFNNRLYNHFNKLKAQGDMTLENLKSAMLMVSNSQALHRGNLANQIIDRGNYDYDEVTNRWTAVDDAVNMTKFEDLIRSLGTKLGVSPNRARQIMGAAYEANRLQSMYQDLSNTKAELTRAEKALPTIKDPKQRAIKKELIKGLEAKVEELTNKVQHKSYKQVQAGMQLYNAHPEIKEGTAVWNTMRERVVKLLVDTGVKTEEQAQTWLDEAAYVPFFRDMEEEKATGPQVVARGLRESMKDYRLKGSQREVNDVIENMYQWMQWSIARGISNKQLQVMADNYKKYLPEEIKEGKGDKASTFTIYRDGVPKYYNVADPAIAQAFMGLEPIVFPAIQWFADTSNFLRHAVTRFPVFPVVQLFNDSYNAMFVSGLKNPFQLLKEIAKETVATARGESETREMLKKAGILETHDYNALNEAEAIGQRLNLEEPGAWAKLAKNLDRFSSASDNIIRQGIYNQARKEGLSHVEAMEKAAEVVNFRRLSGDPRVQFLSRIVPFFNAYTQVASVAVKTLTGRGISPQEREAAIKTLIATTAKVMALSMVYSMAIGDDEDYQRKNRVSRDRMFMIPGSGGFGVPIRMDIFAIPKLAGEYGYQLMSDAAFTDPKMAREAIARAVKGSLNPPSEGIPQLIRPALGVMMNYDSFQDREIINATMRRLDPEEQYTKNTSEIAKALGAMTGISPLNIDFLLRGYLGSVATLGSLATNDIINAARGGAPRPDRSLNDIISSLPNMGAMMSKDDNTAVLTDFYEVARDVNKANATLGSLKFAPKEKQEAYREEHKAEIALKTQVQAINKQLVMLKRREQMVRQLPEERMSAEQKQIELKRIDDQRSRMMRNIMQIRQKLYG